MRISFGNFSIGTDNDRYYGQTGNDPLWTENSSDRPDSYSYRDQNGNLVTKTRNYRKVRAISGMAGGVGMVVVGVVFIAVSFFVRSMSHIEAGWKQVSARVTSVVGEDENQCSDDADGYQTCKTVTYYTPTLAYTVNGKTVTAKGDRSSDVKVGDSIEIAYEPGNATNIKTVSSAQTAGVFSWFMLAGGVISMIAGVWQIVSGKKTGRFPHSN